MSKGKTIMFSIIGIGAVVCMIGIMPQACTNESSSRHALQSQGFDNIEFHGYSWFACGEDDSFATKFSATNPKGQHVEGTVCCGLMKNCTVRF